TCRPARSRGAPRAAGGRRTARAARRSARRGRGTSCEREHREELLERGDPLGPRPVDGEAARVRGREHAAPKALPRGLAEARLGAPDGPHLAGEPDLAPHRYVVGEPAAAGGGGDRRNPGQAGPSARKAAEGFGTSASPPSPISNTATSLVEPKRFLTARSTRRACAPSPSK